MSYSFLVTWFIGWSELFIQGLFYHVYAFAYIILSIRLKPLIFNISCVYCFSLTSFVASENSQFYFKIVIDIWKFIFFLNEFYASLFFLPSMLHYNIIIRRFEVLNNLYGLYFLSFDAMIFLIGNGELGACYETWCTNYCWVFRRCSELWCASYDGS